MEAILGTVLFLAIVAGFFFPAILSFWKRDENAKVVLAINILGGWTFIGWIVALVAALGAASRRRYHFEIPAEDLEKVAMEEPAESFFRKAVNEVEGKEKKIKEAYAEKIPLVSDYIPGDLGVRIWAGIFLGLILAYPISAIIGWISGEDIIGRLYAVLFFFIAAIYPIFEKMVLLPEHRSKIDQKVDAINRVKEKYIDIYLRELKNSFGEQVHALGMMTPEDMIKRINALPANDDLAERYLEQEVVQGDMSKIDLQEGGFLYKSEKQNISELDSCETIHLEIS